jgi:hypothetical protein
MFWVLIYLRIVSPKQVKTNDTLHFKVHDMRVPLKKSDAILFVYQFGYFENEEDNHNYLNTIKKFV